MQTHTHTHTHTRARDKLWPRFIVAMAVQTEGTHHAALQSIDTRAESGRMWGGCLVS